MEHRVIETLCENSKPILHERRDHPDSVTIIARADGGKPTAIEGGIPAKYRDSCHARIPVEEGYFLLTSGQLNGQPRTIVYKVDRIEKSSAGGYATLYFAPLSDLDILDEPLLDAFNAVIDKFNSDSIEPVYVA